MDEFDVIVIGGGSAGSAVSRFLTRCSTARRAERGPSPGSRASADASVSISCDAMG